MHAINGSAKGPQWMQRELQTGGTSVGVVSLVCLLILKNLFGSAHSTFEEI